MIFLRAGGSLRRAGYIDTGFCAISLCPYTNAIQWVERKSAADATQHTMCIVVVRLWRKRKILIRDEWWKGDWMGNIRKRHNLMTLH